MLGFDGKAARITWTVIGILLLVEAAWLARTAILAFVVALLLAYLIAPAVDLAQRLAAGRVSRPVVLGAVYLVLVAVVGSAVFVVASRIAVEASQLAAQIPKLLADGNGGFDPPLPAALEPYREGLREYIDEHAKEMVPALGRIGTGLLSSLGNVLYVVLIPILSFLFLLEAPAARLTIEGLFPHPSQRLFVNGIVDDVHTLLGGYMRAMSLLAAAAFVGYTLFFEAARVPYALLLAGAAGVLEFVPVVGPLSGALLALGVAAFSGYPHWGWMIAFFVLFRLFQDYVVQPWLLSSGIEIHPILVLFGALAGEEIAGVPGLFLSVPVMAIFRILYRRWQ